MDEVKKLPIGEEFFKDIRTKDFYYVDKTDFIAKLLRTRGRVNLFTRPRRFGKSLNMDMLKSFFEIGADTSLFEGLEISAETQLCKHHMGKYPVISISLKDVEGSDFGTAYDNLGIQISEEAARFDFLAESGKLTPSDKAKLQQLIDGGFRKKAFLCSSLKLLTRLLSKHYDRQVIVLIDEYDVPLDKAYQKGYYPETVELIRSLLSQTLKTNRNLEFAVITGCLRIAKESIFTGLNNFKIYSISDADCAEYFGFTDREVMEMLKYYGVEERFTDLKEWYDGYHFGPAEVYCPWDVINQCDRLRVSRYAKMEPHWENSSSNSIVQNMLKNATETTKAEIETLISGGSIHKTLIPELTYADLESPDAEVRQTYLWSVLFATGYLTDIGEANSTLHRLTIPNKEVLGIYEKKIRLWFRVKITSDTERWKKFCTAIKHGDCENVQLLFNEFMSDCISIRDTYIKKEMKENFYHGMLLGLLETEGSWIVKSNVESGIGYTDIKLTIPTEKIGCVIEVKYAENGAFDSSCHEAMEQIDTGGYVMALKQEGCKPFISMGLPVIKRGVK